MLFRISREGHHQDCITLLEVRGPRKGVGIWPLRRWVHRGPARALVTDDRGYLILTRQGSRLFCLLARVMQDWERDYFLTKARAMVDGKRDITKCPAATRAATPQEAKQKRVEVAPLSLKGRVERDEPLPEVEVEREAGDRKRARSSSEGEEKEDEGAYKKEELRAVVGHVVQHFTGVFFVELMQWARQV